MTQGGGEMCIWVCEGIGGGLGVQFHLIACCLLSFLPNLPKQPYLYPRVQCTLFLQTHILDFDPQKSLACRP